MDPSARRREGVFVVEGPVLVAEAVAAGLRLVDVYVDESDETDALGGVAVTVLSDRAFRAVASTDAPRSPLAVCEIPSAPDLADVHGWVMVADRLSDPGNLGTLVRSAEAAGADAVVVTRGTVDVWSPKCVRSAAGASFHVPIVTVDDLAAVTAAGFTAIGTTSHGAAVDGRVDEMGDCDFSGRVAVVLGNESRGLEPDAPVSRWTTITHRGRSESLNVAMAGTVLAMHVSRVRSRG